MPRLAFPKPIVSPTPSASLSNLEPVEIPSYPLYNTTFLTHRLSPLHIQPSKQQQQYYTHQLNQSNQTLTNPILDQYASTLRDILTGSTLRGVRIGLSSTQPSSDSSNETDALSRAGSLQHVQWRLLASEADWPDEVKKLARGEEPDAGIHARHVGMLCEIVYENAEYLAVFLQARFAAAEGEGREENPQHGGFVHYPLLLTRMPTSLRVAFLNFLIDTFDARISAPEIPAELVAGAVEDYLKAVTGAGGEDAGLPAIQAGLKDVLLTFSFGEGAKALKSLDVLLPRSDLGRMMARGRGLVAQAEAAAGNGKGKGRATIAKGKSSPTEKVNGPFMRALAAYLNAHLALDLSHPDVALAKVACAGFVLGRDGRVKVFEPREGEGRGILRVLIAGLMGAERGVGKGIS